MKEVEISLKEPRLTQPERLYVKAYQSTLTHSKAFKLLRPELKSHGSSNNPYFKSDAVQYHIKKNMILRMESLDINEDKVLDLLLQEATRLGSGSSPTARVQALTLLGKHLHMFEDKEQEANHAVFNIVNYSSSKEIAKIENKEERVEEITPLSLNIKINEYK